MMMYGMKVFAAVAMVGVGGVRVHMDEVTQPLLSGSNGDMEMDVRSQPDPSELYFGSFNCGGLEKMGTYVNMPLENRKAQMTKQEIIDAIQGQPYADEEIELVLGKKFEKDKETATEISFDKDGPFENVQGVRTRGKMNQIAQSIVDETDSQELIFVGLQEIFELKGAKQVTHWWGRNGVVDYIRRSIQAALTKKYAKKKFGYYHLTETTMWAQHMVVFAKGPKLSASAIKAAFSHKSPTWAEALVRIKNMEGFKLVDPATMSVHLTDNYAEEVAVAVDQDVITYVKQVMAAEDGKFQCQGSFHVDSLRPWKPYSFWPGNKGAVVTHITMNPDNEAQKKSVLAINSHLPSDYGEKADKDRLVMADEIQQYYSNYYPSSLSWKSVNYFEDAAGNKKNVVFIGDTNARLNLNPKKDKDKITARFATMRDEISKETFDGAVNFSETFFKGLDNFRNGMTGDGWKYSKKVWYKLWLGNSEWKFGEQFHWVEGNLNFLPTYKIQGTEEPTTTLASPTVQVPSQVRNRSNPSKRISSASLTTDEQLSSELLGIEHTDESVITIGNLQYSRNLKKDNGKIKYYMPCWTDRVLFQGHGVTQAKAKDNITKYGAVHALATGTGSDHAMVFATIKVS